MLAKLLKYDMKSVARVWWILAITALGASVVGAASLRFALTFMENEDLFLLCFMGILVFFGSVLAIVATALVTELLIYWRFYKHFFTDEGYLTFTLPVSRKKLFFSKTFNALFWMGLEIVLIFVCVLIFCVIAPPAENGLIAWEMFEAIGRELALLWEAMGAWIFVYAILFLVMTFAALLLSINLIHLCITIGAVIAKKAKLLAAIGIYYGMNMVFSFVSQIAIYVFSLVFAGGIFGLMESASMWMMHLGIVLFMLLAVAIIATIASLIYCITLGLMERKLNLA